MRRLCAKELLAYYGDPELSPVRTIPIQEAG
jgi:hypothetical protein